MLWFVLQWTLIKSQQDSYLELLGNNNFSRSEIERVKGITFDIANFGDVPFGHSLHGSLILSNPADACEVLIRNKTQEYPKGVIVLADRKPCNFVQKAKHVQDFGAQALIIENNEFGTSGKIVLADDGGGQFIHIPTIFIQEENGDFLKELINKSENKQLDFAINFNSQIYEQSDLILILHLDLLSEDTFKMLRQFEPYFKKFNDNDSIHIDIHYMLCPECSGDQFCMSKTINDIKYQACALNTKNGDSILGKDTNGKEIVREQINQICLFKLFPLKYFKYMEKFDKECEELIDEEKEDLCFKKFIKKLLSEDEIKTLNFYIEENFDDIYKEEINVSRNSGVLNYPEYSINHVNQRGNKSGYDIYQAICSALQVHIDFIKMCESEYDEITSKIEEINKQIKMNEEQLQIKQKEKEKINQSNQYPDLQKEIQKISDLKNEILKAQEVLLELNDQIQRQYDVELQKDKQLQENMNLLRNLNDKYENDLTKVNYERWIIKNLYNNMANEVRAQEIMAYDQKLTDTSIIPLIFVLISFVLLAVFCYVIIKGKYKK